MLKLTTKSRVKSPTNSLNNNQHLSSNPLFGTDGIRGKVGEVLTAPLAEATGFWSGKVLQESAITPGPVIIGQDSRNSSPMLAEAIASGLNRAGVEVWQIGLCPTPTVAYLAKETAAIGGIMVSASHNPPEDNGIKFFEGNGLKISKKLAKNIENALRSQGEISNYDLSTPHTGKTHNYPQLTQNYLESLLNSLPAKTNFSGLRIVLDLAWGAAVNLAPEAFVKLGAEVISLHSQANGDRINVNCGSTHLQPLQTAIQEYKADLGFAFDGDADRVIAVDSVGRIIDGDHILYFWGQYLQQQDCLPNNLIIATVMANLGFENAWQKLGGKMIRTPVGDQHVQSQMWSSGSMLGGEQSGHILCHHHSVSGDGIQTALHLTSLICEWKTCLKTLRENSFTSYPQLLRNVRVKNRQVLETWKDCQVIQGAIAKASENLGNQGRILVRASGTEPLIRVMVEARDHHLANYWTEHLVTVVSNQLA